MSEQTVRKNYNMVTKSLHHIFPFLSTFFVQIRVLRVRRIQEGKVVDKSVQGGDFDYRITRERPGIWSENQTFFVKFPSKTRVREVVHIIHRLIHKVWG